MRRFPVALFVLASLSARAALAAPPSEAERLFHEAQGDMAEKRYEAACRKFEASRGLEKTAGALLNLANCHQTLGSLVRARSEWRQALSELPPGDARATDTKRAIAELDARIPTVRFVVPEEPPPAAAIRIDGEIVDPAAWGGGTPLDPGIHDVTASARGSSKVERVVLREGDRATLRLFHDMGAPEAAAHSQANPGSMDAPRSSAPVASVGFVIGGVGLVGAIGTGLVVLHEKHAADAGCPTRATCNADGADAAERGRVWLVGNAVAWAVTAAGVGVGLYATLRPRGSHASGAAPNLSIGVTPAGAGQRIVACASF